MLLSHLSPEVARYRRIEAVQSAIQKARGVGFDVYSELVPPSVREGNEDNCHHGWPHLRRVSKLGALLMLNSPEVTVDEAMALAVPFEIAVRTHDWAQQETGDKFAHDKMAALALMEGMPPLAEKYGLSPFGVYAAIAMTYYHSHPETFTGEVNLPDPGLLRDGITSVFRQKFGDSVSLEEYFPSLWRISQRQGPQFSPPSMTEREQNTVAKGVLLFAAADKLDALVPGSLAAFRTSQTMPRRPFCIPAPGCSVEEECHRRVDEAAHQASDDVSRTLYEVLRPYHRELKPTAYAATLISDGLHGRLSALVELAFAMARGDYRWVEERYAERIESLHRRARERGIAGERLNRAISKVVTEQEEFLRVLLGKSATGVDPERVGELAQCARRRIKFFAPPANAAGGPPDLTYGYDTL